MKIWIVVKTEMSGEWSECVKAFVEWKAAYAMAAELNGLGVPGVWYAVEGVPLET